MNNDNNEIAEDIIKESKTFTLRCFIVIITTIYFFVAYKIISKRLSYLLNKHNVENFFSSFLGEINIFNTFIIMIFIYLVYYIGKKVLSKIFKQNFEITDLTQFFLKSF